MRHRFLSFPPKRAVGRRQRLLPFLERTLHLERWFKHCILVLTISMFTTAIALSGVARQFIAMSAEKTRLFALRNIIGLEPTRVEIDALRRLRREKTEHDTRQSLEHFYNNTSIQMRHLFDEAAMNPSGCLIGVGRASNGFLLSSRVFEAVTDGCAYRLRPGIRSVWLRQITLHEGPFGLFLVPDDPSVWQAAGAVGAIVDETSRQSTNSWGLRGPEPNPQAEIRGIVLGDSFMQGMFNDDEHTPPLLLQQYLESRWGSSVCVLNTGHIGYAPEQYFCSLKAFGPRFTPHFVIVSVCPNDFGDGDEVMSGRGDDWDEAAYWMDEILRWCRAGSIPCLVVPAPVDRQILHVRKDAWYPGRVANRFQGASYAYCDPFEYFLDEHMKLRHSGFPPQHCDLFNYRINDNHFSPRGAALWAEVVGRRLSNMMNPPTMDVGKQSNLLRSEEAKP